MLKYKVLVENKMTKNLGGFMKRVYFGFEMTNRYKILTLITFLLLLISVYTVIFFGDWYFVLLLVIAIIIQVLWLMISLSAIKTRIEFNEATLFAPYYVWYEGFEAHIDSKFMTEEIAYQKMTKLEVIDAYISFQKKWTKAFKIEVEHSFTRVVLLDRFSEEELLEIIKHVTSKVEKEIKA